MDLKQLKQEFDQLSPREQYVWLMKQDKSLFMIYLDNDTADLCFHSDIQTDYTFTFKRCLGNRKGVELLLQSIGMEVQFV